MHTINIPTQKRVITDLVFGHNAPCIFWGPPGAGKSAGAAQAAAENDALLVDIRLSQYDSVDLRGFPGVGSDGLTVWHAPSTLPFKGNPHFPTDRKILLFFDEINAATPAVSAVTYQIINDRRCGEHELMDNVYIIAAGNREGDRGVTNRMPLPLANRLVHFEIGVDHTAVCEHYAKIGISPIAIAFYHFKPSQLMTFDPASTNKAFSTPRSVERAMRFFADTKLSDDIKRAGMAGAMGHGEAADFWGFVDIYQKVTPISQIIADPEGVDMPSAQEPGLRWAMAIHVSGHMIPDDPVAGTKGNIGPLHTYLKRMPGDMTVVAWQLAVMRNSKIFTAKEYLDFSKTYRAVFQ
jgi:hypothetical protein